MKRWGIQVQTLRHNWRLFRLPLNLSRISKHIMDEPGSSPIKDNHKTWISATKSHSDVPLSFAADFPDTHANLKSEDGVIGTDQ